MPIARELEVDEPSVIAFDEEVVRFRITVREHQKFAMLRVVFGQDLVQHGQFGGCAPIGCHAEFFQAVRGLAPTMSEHGKMAGLRGDGAISCLSAVEHVRAAGRNRVKLADRTSERPPTSRRPLGRGMCGPLAGVGQIDEAGRSPWRWRSRSKRGQVREGEVSAAGH